MSCVVQKGDHHRLSNLQAIECSCLRYSLYADPCSLGGNLIQLWLWLWLCLSNQVGAQEPAQMSAAGETPAAQWAVEVEPETSGDWQRFSIEVHNENERPKPGVLLLLGFQQVDEQTGRPLPGAAPDFELVLEQEPDTFPRAYDLWLLPSLNWYVVASVDIRPAKMHG